LTSELLNIKLFNVSATLDFRQTTAIRLLRALVEAYTEIEARDDVQIRTYGLSGTEFDCLSWLGVAGPMRMCDLAQSSLTTKSRVTQVMGQLEEKGLARRERSSENDREVLASLTREGRELFERVYPQQYQFLKSFFNGRLDEDEQKQLTALLCKLVNEPDSAS
jgi:MarR family 2-MHQ and catechol resistance regulon transcriptional repressor